MSNIKHTNTIAIMPKIILIVVSIICIVTAFVPWIDFGHGSKSDLGPIGPIYITVGAIPLVLNLLALIIRRRGMSLAANVLGIICGLVAILYLVMFFLGSNMLGSGVSSTIMDNLSVGVWTAGVSGLGLFIISIVSIARDKKKSRTLEEEY